MSDTFQIKYDPNASITSDTIMGSVDHVNAALTLARGMMPHTLLDITSKSNHYRDAILYQLAAEAQPEEKDRALAILTKAMSTLPDGDTRLNAYSEYAAAIALLTNREEIAAKVILRNERKSASNFLATLATVIAKSVDVNTFTRMVKDAGEVAVMQWVNFDRPSLFPGHN